MKPDMTWRETKLMVRNHAGIHARAAAKLVHLARQFQSTIRIRHRDRWADASSILDVMTLGVGPGEEIEAAVSGEDADTAVPALQQLFDGAFDEQDPFNEREPLNTRETFNEARSDRALELA